MATSSSQRTGSSSCNQSERPRGPRPTQNTRPCLLARHHTYLGRGLRGGLVGKQRTTEKSTCMNLSACISSARGSLGRMNRVADVTRAPVYSISSPFLITSLACAGKTIAVIRPGGEMLHMRAACLAASAQFVEDAWHGVLSRTGVQRGTVLSLQMPLPFESTRAPFAFRISSGSAPHHSCVAQAPASFAAFSLSMRPSWHAGCRSDTCA